VNAVDLLAGLEPAGVWQRFGELTAIPRPPKEEEQARSYVLEWADRLGFEGAVDAGGNVAVRVPATSGREGAPVVVLQAHLDIVCEREPWSDYDPREGRIRVEREDDWVVAPETTLGADNGIGVAAAMAVAEDPSLAHGPLELLFTVSEEQGLEGAKALDPASVQGRLLLNLDGTSDHSLTIGCAGSTHTFTRLPLALEAVGAGNVGLLVRLAGARGGHSGGDIDKGRANANKALGRVLSGANQEAPFRLASFGGGVSRNAIPRDSEAVLALRAGEEASFRDAAQRALDDVRGRFAGTDEGLTLEIAPADVDEPASEETTRRLLDLVAVLPTGVLAMSTSVPGKVETSSSLNVATTDDGVVTLASMTRSANASALDEVVSGIVAAARLAGAEVEIKRSYPPWRPDVDSPLLATARATFERLFEESPTLDVVHGGLECAVIGDKLPGVQMLSLGPKVEGPHAPGERLSISSTQRFYRLLGALLDDLSR
jgi:dipeptidase D